jgi:Rps23 Pro-64 3,4-dihydroxylase Tpa1-like proline 4-hydroxylase
MKLNKRKKLHNFPGVVVEKFLNKNFCNKIIVELDRFNNFDDFVMSGRNRINKGSNNFQKFLENSKFAKNLFKKFNKKKTFQNIEKSLSKVDDFNFNYNVKNYSFSKTNYGLQKGTRLVKKNYNSKKNIINLDVDFSVSEKGYCRGPHKDRESRILNFLIYLNSIPKKEGGSLVLYKPKKNYSKLSRFPLNSNLSKLETVTPVTGRAIFFKSTPFSYHAVKKFLPSKKRKRYFIYGSFSLNKKVSWQVNV